MSSSLDHDFDLDHHDVKLVTLLSQDGPVMTSVVSVSRLAYLHSPLSLSLFLFVFALLHFLLAFFNKMAFFWGVRWKKLKLWSHFLV